MKKSLFVWICLILILFFAVSCAENGEITKKTFMMSKVQGVIYDNTGKAIHTSSVSTEYSAFKDLNNYSINHYSTSSQTEEQYSTTESTTGSSVFSGNSTKRESNQKVYMKTDVLDYPEMSSEKRQIVKETSIFDEKSGILIKQSSSVQEIDANGNNVGSPKTSEIVYQLTNLGTENNLTKYKRLLSSKSVSQNQYEIFYIDSNKKVVKRRIIDADNLRFEEQSYVLLQPSFGNNVLDLDYYSSTYYDSISFSNKTNYSTVEVQILSDASSFYQIKMTSKFFDASNVLQNTGEFTVDCIAVD